MATINYVKYIDIIQTEYIREKAAFSKNYLRIYNNIYKIMNRREAYGKLT